MSRSRVEDRPVLLPAVEYARAGSIDEAIHLLSSNDGARALAGGQTLINVMKARATAPDVLVDLADLAELRTISFVGDTLEIGAMATYAQLMTSSEIDVSRPIIAEVVAQIADVQVRNRGTIGGNVCSNDPTNHLPPLLVALGATFTIQGPRGVRWVSSDDFFLGVYLTAVGEGELLVKISVPAGGGAGDGFAGITIGVDGTCIANAAATLAGESPRVALGCVSAVPVVVEPGGTDDDSIRAAVREAEFQPPSDVHATADYRRHLAEVCAVRAVRQAEERRKG
jgi:aerobic carbon-monoxide dehydrogenase medium subunit